MRFRVGWGLRISSQFALVVLPLAVLLFTQAWLELRRSAQLADAFPLHLEASAARKNYRQFVDGVTDAVDSDKLPRQALDALQKASATLHAIAQHSNSRDAASLDADLASLAGKLSAGATLDRLLPLRATINDVNKGLQRLDEEYENQTRAVIVATAEGAQRQIVMVWLAAGLALALAVYFVRAMIARLTQPLRDGIRIARAIALGDLSVAHRVKGQDETAQLLNALSTMTDALREIVGNVRTSSDGIHAASSEFATGNRDLSERTEKAARSLQGTARSVDHITQTMRQSAGNASRANQLASSASNVACKGGEVIGQVVATMATIEASSKKISEIIRVIDSIAFQTNILALNAAVEAARAGEQGRGFAVVASEVRALAHRSAEAAREIKALIEESVNKVHSGSNLVVDAGKTMQEIVQQVRGVSELIAEISAGSASQAGEIERLQKVIVELDGMTQQNAAMVEQSAAASESMKGLAASLAQAVSLFHLENTAGSNSAHPPSSDRRVAPARVHRATA
jgi:methyl-accepting chemotaxis protein